MMALVVRRFQIIALFLLILVLLGYGFQKSGLASVFSDPVSGFRAQDETTYTSGAVGMATGGEWLTPIVLGRFYMQKPPVLMWLAGLSMRVLGISLFALRLPVLLAGALATLLLFLWAERHYSLWIGAAAALLALSNPLWHMLSRLCYMDMLLVLAMIAALRTFDRDWNLSERRSRLEFGGWLAFGVMAKNIAGLLTLAIVLLSCLLARRKPPLFNLLKACSVTLLLVAPWHLYQLASHARWFFADYVQTALLGFGLNPAVQPSADGQVWFYVKRLMLTDPLLAALGVLALPNLLRGVRAGKHEAALLCAWVIVTGGALLAFHYRDWRYLSYVLPPLCLMAASTLARAGIRPKVAAAALVAVFCVKVSFGSQIWGVPFAPLVPLPAAKWLRWYEEQGRPNELIEVDSDDEFYATTLPLPKVRYCYLDPTQLVRRVEPHYGFLGITVTATQFEDLTHWEPLFRQRLLAWGLDSTAPMATNIMSDSMEGIVHLVVSHPGSDFYLPASIIGRLPSEVIAGRRLWPLSNGRWFLLSPGAPTRQPARRAWAIPKDW